MSINRDTPIPLYYQLAEQIKSQILGGELKAGEQIPSERDYSEQLAISRMTVRQALRSLIHQGLLVTQKGVGTFVAEPKLNQDMLHLRSFTENMMQSGNKATSSQVLEQSLVEAPRGVALQLRLRSREKAIKIARLRLYANEPLLLETIYVPEALCPGLENREFGSTSLYEILEKDYGLHQQYAEQSLEATVANDYESKLFKINRGIAMILLEGVTYLEDGQPVEYFKSVYRGDRFKFKLTSQRVLVRHDVGTPQFLVGVDVVHQ